MRNDSDMASVSDSQAVFETAIAVDKIVCPIMYIFGFPGNILACVVWLQPRMRHSSGTYFAALGMTDFLFLILHVLFHLYKYWNVQMFDAPIICELLPVVYMALQYLSPLLVLGFTVERFIGVCFPLKRSIFCTPFRARIVSLCLAIFSLGLGSMQGYLYQYNSISANCGIRSEAMTGGHTSLWSIWTWVTEMLIFMCIPLLILLFNILIIREIKRLTETGTICDDRPHTTTFSLLVVSFFFIVTTFPVSIVYAIRNYYIPSDDETVVDPDLQARYILAKTIIEEIGISHYACKFYIFLLAERTFREEVINLGLRLRSYCWKHKMNYVQQTEDTIHTSYNDTELVTSGNPDETKF